MAHRHDRDATMNSSVCDEPVLMDDYWTVEDLVGGISQSYVDDDDDVNDFDLCTSDPYGGVATATPSGLSQEEPTLMSVPESSAPLDVERGKHEGQSAPVSETTDGVDRDRDAVDVYTDQSCSPSQDLAQTLDHVADCTRLSSFMRAWSERKKVYLGGLTESRTTTNSDSGGLKGDRVSTKSHEVPVVAEPELDDPTSGDEVLFVNESFANGVETRGRAVDRDFDDGFDTDGSDEPRWLKRTVANPAVAEDAKARTLFLDGVWMECGNENWSDVADFFPLLSQYLIGRPQAVVSRKQKRGNNRYFGEERSTDVMAEKVVVGCWVCGKVDHESVDCFFKRCFLCSEQGHEVSECSNARLWCRRCGARGHVTQACPQIEYEAALDSPEAACCRCMKCGAEGHVQCCPAPRADGGRGVARRPEARRGSSWNGDLVRSMGGRGSSGVDGPRKSLRK